jgi:hypothetical protein
LTPVSHLLRRAALLSRPVDEALDRFGFVSRSVSASPQKRLLWQFLLAMKKGRAARSALVASRVAGLFLPGRDAGGLAHEELEVAFDRGEIEFLRFEADPTVSRTGTAPLRARFRRCRGRME